MTVTVKAVRDYLEEPIFCKLDSEPPEAITCAYNESLGTFPAQKKDGGVLILVTMSKGQEAEFSLLSTPYDRFKVDFKQENEKLDVLYGGKLFTSYNYMETLKKPFLGPILTPDGNSFTRADLQHREHPHHRSVFLGVGDVSLDGKINNIDLWNEPEDSGYLRMKKPAVAETGSVFSSFSAENIWCSNDGTPMMDEKRTFTFYTQSEACRYIDLEFTFFANYGDITFGNSKEAGPLGFRVNEDIKVDNGGFMKNSYGAEGESECWGKSAQWCLYGGKLNGKACAAAIFDNEQNERYPTTWHIRNYGLFAANNLYFRGGLKIKKGESLTYKYRLCFFNSNGESASDRFIIYNTQN